MADGSTKSIDKIKVGDEVKSRDPATGKDKDEPVLRLYIHPAPQIMELHLSDGEVITCTPEHRFYVPGKGFEEAGTLSDGDRLVHDDDATSAHSTTAAIMPPLKISDITWDTKATSLSTATTVYNFEVASTHTYFVGTESGGVWVHNACDIEGAGGGRNIALGLEDNLENFASSPGINGDTWRDWGTDDFTGQFLSVVSDPDNNVFFNLDGIDTVFGAAQRGASGISSVTDWELSQIYANRFGWGGAVRFFENGAEVGHPFL